MKNHFFGMLTALVVIQMTASAQQTPEALLGQLPAIPTIVCSADTAVVNQFTSRIYKMQSALKEVTDRINDEVMADEEKSMHKISSDLARQSGLDQEDIEQEDLTEAQAMKAAAAMVKEQYNISLQDLEQVGDMSDAEQEEWAQNFASGKMQQAKKNPQAALKNQDKNARMFGLAKEQKAIVEEIDAKKSKLTRLYKNLETQDSIEQGKLEAKIDPLEKELCSGICSPAEIARSRAAEKQIYNLRLQHCEKMSIVQNNYIQQYLTEIKTFFPLTRRLEQIQSELSGLTYGAVQKPDDLSCYVLVEEYSNVLLTAYKYWVGKFEQ